MLWCLLCAILEWSSCVYCIGMALNVQRLYRPRPFQQLCLAETWSALPRLEVEKRWPFYYQCLGTFLTSHHSQKTMGPLVWKKAFFALGFLVELVTCYEMSGFEAIVFMSDCSLYELLIVWVRWDLHENYISLMQVPWSRSEMEGVLETPWGSYCLWETGWKLVFWKTYIKSVNEEHIVLFNVLHTALNHISE